MSAFLLFSFSQRSNSHWLSTNTDYGSHRSDLHRFLADSLEYRARLEEIRDGVLGIERRRKGMWKVVRMVAADWIEEENF